MHSCLLFSRCPLTKQVNKAASIRRAIKPLDQQRGHKPLKPPSPAAEPQHAVEQQLASQARRKRIKEAIEALAASDEFVDLIVDKLQASGAVQ